MARVLGQALQSRQRPDFDAKLAAYLESLKKFHSLLKADESKYFDFQIWKEGIARYTEYHLAKLAAVKYEPSKEFQALKDYKSFRDVAQDILRRMEEELETVQLDKSKRTVVYNFGAAEGLILDRARPDWRKRYFENRFTLEPHFHSEK
jgi:hypothetical protein